MVQRLRLSRVQNEGDVLSTTVLSNDVQLQPQPLDRDFTKLFVNNACEIVSASFRYRLFCTLFYFSQIGNVYNNFDHISVTDFFFRVPQLFRNGN